VPHTIIQASQQFGSAVYKVALDTRVVMRMLYSSFLEPVTGRVGGLLLNGGTDVYNEVLRHILIASWVE
jgi:hypothetical protein